MLYVFSCRDCNKVKELECRIKDKPKSIQCTCGGTMLQDFSKQGMSFQLIGHGWCKDEYCTVGSLKAENERANREARGSY